MATGLEKQAPFATVEEAIEDIRAGKFVVAVDAADRENEGDLTIAAQFATPEAINFMATHGRGLVCLCLTEERCDELGLEPMTDRNETPFGTAFTVSVEAREGVATGISALTRGFWRFSGSRVPPRATKVIGASNPATRLAMSRNLVSR